MDSRILPWPKDPLGDEDKAARKAAAERASHIRPIVACEVVNLVIQQPTQS